MRLLGELTPWTTAALAKITRDLDACEDLADHLRVKLPADADAEDALRKLLPAATKWISEKLVASADMAKFEREIDEKYGLFKWIVLHPTTQMLMAVLARQWQRFHLFRPPIGLGGGITIFIFMYRSRQMGASLLALSACMLAGLNPGIVLVVMALWRLWRSRRYMPRGYRLPARPFDPPADSDYHRAVREGRPANRLFDHFAPSKVGAIAAAADGGGGGAKAPYLNGAVAGRGGGGNGSGRKAAAGHSHEGAGPSDGGGRGDAIYDHIIIGSDMSALYAAALLSLCGHRCLVLERRHVIGGDATILDPEAAASNAAAAAAAATAATNAAAARDADLAAAAAARPLWQFDTRYPVIGRPRIADLISVACHPSAEAPEWNYIAAGGDGPLETSIYASVESGTREELLFPAGTATLSATMACAAPEHRRSLYAIIAQVADAFKDAAPFFMQRTVTASAAATMAALGVRPFAAAVISCGDAFKAIQDGPLLSLLSTLFTAENIPFQSVAFGAYVLHAAQRFDGQFVTQYGWEGLVAAILPTIEAAGGRVLTAAPVAHVVAEGGRAIGVKMEKEAGGAVIWVRPGGSIISAIGVLETFNNLLTQQTFDEIGGWPAGFTELEEVRPRVHMCVGLQGNWAERFAAPPYDFVHSRDPLNPPEQHDLGVSSEWYRISFTEPKHSNRRDSGRTCCVVTAELGDDLAKRCKGRVLSSTAAAATAAGPHAVDKGSAEPASAAAGGAAAGTGAGTAAAPTLWHVLHGRSREKLKERLLRRLHEHFPATEGRDEFVWLVDAVRPGLSHTPARYAAAELRAPTALPGLILGSQDLTVESFEGQVQAGWMAAHAALGYGAADFILRRRTLVGDLEFRAARAARPWWQRWL